MKSIDDLLVQAARMSRKGGGGGGGGKPMPSEGDPDGQRNGKKGPEEKKDPGEKDGTKPDDPEKSRSQDVKKGPAPPKTPAEAPGARDLKGVFFAKLPDKVREAVLNGDFDQVPERYRDLIREWTKALAEKEKKESGAGEDEGR